MQQLVLQFSDKIFARIEDLWRLEESISSLVGETSTEYVDGHDFGEGVANIFIITQKPAMIFHRVLPLLQQEGVETALRAAYRSADSDQYVPLWPSEFTEFSL